MDSSNNKRTYLSGSRKRKKQKDNNEELKKLQAQATKYFKSPSASNKKVTDDSIQPEGSKDIIPVENGSESPTSADQINSDFINYAEDAPTKCTSETDAFACSDDDFDIEGEQQTSPLERPVLNFIYLDPVTWPVDMPLHAKKQIACAEVTLDSLTVGLSSKMKDILRKYFIGKNKNGETFQRDWMRFGSNEALFCMACCLFGNNSEKSPWRRFGDAIGGFSDFHNSLRGISKHETCDIHRENVKSWKLFCRNVETESSIVGNFTRQSEENASRWRIILHAILDAVMYLAQNNLAFLGHSSNLTDENCGNFLSLIKLLAKYHTPLAQHLEKLHKKSISYLSPEIQNEFIYLCGEEVRQTILRSVKERKYYSIMFDSTPDVSRMDQLSQIVRTVECSKSGCKIHENFVDFVATTSKTGADLKDVILAKLESDGLDITDCRGQGYDNGSNMAGKYKGVQARILEINPEAEFYECAAHSMNLVGTNAAEKNLESKLLLGRIQNIYTFISGSTARWEIMKRHLKLNLKGHSDTRWSSRADAVKALFEQYESVLQGLNEISSSEKFKPDVIAASENHIRDMMTFKFLLGLAVWNELLQQINLCNINLQERDTDISLADKKLSVLCKWMKTFQVSGFDRCLVKATLIAQKLGIDKSSGFVDKRRGRGINPKYNNKEEVERSKKEENIERFRREFFDDLMKALMNEMEKRFNNLRQAREDFQFLFGKGLLYDEAELEKSVKDLVAKFPRDFNASDFMSEMKSFGLTIVEFNSSGKKTEELSPMDVLNIIYANGLETTYRNGEIAIRIFLTLPVTVASNERSFSKLKLIKNYLRSTMGQARLNGLAILSIERDLSKNVKFNSVIDRFVSIKCRRINEI